MSLPGEFRCSIEPVDRLDPETHSLGIEPAATLAEVKRSRMGPSGLYGKGKDGQEVCLTLKITRLPTLEVLNMATNTSASGGT